MPFLSREMFLNANFKKKSFVQKFIKTWNIYEPFPAFWVTDVCLLFLFKAGGRGLDVEESNCDRRRSSYSGGKMRRGEVRWSGIYPSTQRYEFEAPKFHFRFSFFVKHFVSIFFTGLQIRFVDVNFRLWKMYAPERKESKRFSRSLFFIF